MSDREAQRIATVQAEFDAFAGDYYQTPRWRFLKRRYLWRCMLLADEQIGRMESRA